MSRTPKPIMQRTASKTSCLCDLQGSIQAGDVDYRVSIIQKTTDTILAQLVRADDTALWQETFNSSREAPCLCLVCYGLSYVRSAKHEMGTGTSNTCKRLTQPSTRRNRGALSKSWQFQALQHLRQNAEDGNAGPLRYCQSGCAHHCRSDVRNAL